MYNFIGLYYKLGDKRPKNLTMCDNKFLGLINVKIGNYCCFLFCLLLINQSFIHVINISQRLAYPLISFGLIPLRSAVSFGWMNAPAF